MPFRAPVADYRFVLDHVVGFAAVTATPRFAEATPDLVSAILTEAAKLCDDVLAPLQRPGDLHPARLENGIVRTSPGFAEGYKAITDGGWVGIAAPADHGGMALPLTLATVVNEMMAGACLSLQLNPLMTQGQIEALDHHASDALKALYLPRLISGEWCGTMNLTEPQCGTDLGLMRTRAVPQPDGTYLITGQKIFISAGEHDLADNIIHLVLAKIPGGPEGIKGVSLFIVPKFIVKADGSLGDRNLLSCGKIEEKMGIHGNATCVMNYDGATGYLLGEAHKGMRAMFTMMNDARLGVGLQGYAQAEVAYQNAVAYAKDRLQGRDVTGAKAPEKAADPIIVHPDIRRNLMDQKSFIEGARAFTYWGATLLDRAHKMDDAAADGLVSLLTPVIKGFQTDKGFDYAIAAQQVYGGHGYIEEWGMSQFARDARIAMIYEGANGIQALDLVGRKLALDGGKHVMAFFDLVKGFIKDNDGHPALKSGFLEPLKAASKDMQGAGMYFMQNGVKNPNDALAGSTDFMHLMGHVCLGLMWAKMALAAHEALAAGASDTAFYQAKIATGRYYMTRQLPATAMHLARIMTGAETVMALEAADF